MAGKGGGAWKVAYADFVTAMMAFFLVMWITAQSKQVKVAVSHYFNDPFNSQSKSHGPAPGGGSNTQGPDRPGSDVLFPSKTPGAPPGVARFKTTPKRRGAESAVPGPKRLIGGGPKTGIGEKPIITVLNDGDFHTKGAVILFADDSDALSDRAKEQLRLLVPMLLGKLHKIEIRGHARRRLSPSGTSLDDPWHRCYARCVATKKFLEDAGVEPERIRLSQAGPYEPKTIRSDAASQTMNSCVDVYVLNEYVEDFQGSREERIEQSKTP